MLKIKQFIFSVFDENTYLLVDEATGECVIVDPGMDNEDQMRTVEDFMRSNNLKLTQIIVTHMHLDHIFGANMVRDRYGLKVQAHKADEALGTGFEDQCRRFGLIGKGAVDTDVFLKDGDRIRVGESELEVIHVPGHSPGSIALYSAEGGFVLTGDALFRESIGRTDLPGGSQPQLLESISKRLFTLPDNTAVLPGHGPMTTIGHEKSYNPFFRPRL